MKGLLAALLRRICSHFVPIEAGVNGAHRITGTEAVQEPENPEKTPEVARYAASGDSPFKFICARLLGANRASQEPRTQGKRFAACPLRRKLSSRKDRSICNLYRLTTPASAVAQLFGSETAAGANYKHVVAPTDPGLVIAEGETRAMAWGFPRIDVSKVTGEKLRPHAIYNARSENSGSRFWRGSFARRRCLIPANAWAEAEGEEGRMTRTWFSVPGEDVFALAGIWRRSDEWGHVFSMMMVPGHEAMADLNDRMPVILPRAAWQTWTDGSPTAAHALCSPWPGELVREATDEPWSVRTKKENGAPATKQLSLPL